MDTSSLTPFNGSDYSHDRDAPRLTDQMKRVFGILSTNQWVSLGYIAAATGDPEASISAQIRHLRKARFGGWIIEKKHTGDGLYFYKLTGERTSPATELPSDLTPLPPAAPELLKIAHVKIGQMQRDLESERAKVTVLTAALNSIVRSVPAGISNGDCLYEHFDEEGNHLGTENIDPLSVVQTMAELAAEALVDTAQLDPQISTEKLLKSL